MKVRKAIRHSLATRGVVAIEAVNLIGSRSTTFQIGARTHAKPMKFIPAGV
jgi:hypothetical protein